MQWRNSETGYGLVAIGVHWLVPAAISDLPEQQDIAGDVHCWLAWAVITSSALHAMEAFKHHLFDRDEPLLRPAASRR